MENVASDKMHSVILSILQTHFEKGVINRSVTSMSLHTGDVVSLRSGGTGVNTDTTNSEGISLFYHMCS